jgi:hypothetical protein
MLKVNPQLLKDANLSVDNMSLYLRHHGWQEVPGKNTQIQDFLRIQRTAPVNSAPISV